MAYAYKVKPGEKVSLKDFDPAENGGLSKDDGLKKADKLGKELTDLQELLYAAGQTALLIVLQGMDTSGKDGTIRFLLNYLNAQGTRIAPFKVPTPKELAHDYLWRCHQETPGKGETVVFNRSHYEDVLVVRVHHLVPDDVWKKRYDDINNFEGLLLDNNTLVVKFFLHLSKGEQEQRLLDREKDTEKAWKLSVGDWKERELWEDYQAAYEDALSKCSTEDAPWHIVAADRKWYRDLAVAETLADAIRPLTKGWNEKLVKVGEQAKADIAAYRAGAKPS